MKFVYYDPDIWVEGLYDWMIDDWLPRILRMRIKPSEAFTRTYGDDWALSFSYVAHKNRGKFPKVPEPVVDHREKSLAWEIVIAWVGDDLPDVNAYRVPMRQFLEGIAIVLKRVGFDTSRLSQDLSALVDEFCSIPDVVPTPPAASLDLPITPKTKVRHRRLPKWRIPKKLEKLVDEEGEWESERFAPLRCWSCPVVKPL